MLSADSPPEAFRHSGRVSGIRQVIGLIGNILNRGESEDDERESDIEDSAEGYGSRLGWSGPSDYTAGVIKRPTRPGDRAGGGNADSE